MADELVRVRINEFEKNVGRSFAEAHDLDVLDEPTHKGDGTPRGITRKGGRRPKKKTSVAQAAAEKKASDEPADNIRQGANVPTSVTP